MRQVIAGRARPSILAAVASASLISSPGATKHLSVGGSTTESHRQSPEAIVDTKDADDVVRQCLQEKVTITIAPIERNPGGVHRIEITVTNGLNWPIAGISFAYQVRSEDRAVAWVKRDVAEWIGGG